MLGVTLSHRLWLGFRFYPFTPIWRGLKPPPYPFDHVLVGGLFVCLMAVLLGFRPWISAIGAILFIAVLCAQDQSRMQPWVYQYMFMLGGLGAVERRDPTPVAVSRFLNTCRLIIASVYFWSGLQKMNPGFSGDVFPWMVEPLARVFPSRASSLIQSGGLWAACFEAAIGASLLFRRTRRIAVICAVAMHALVLFSIGPLNHNSNSVIWSWNVVMVLLDLILFGLPDEFSVRDMLSPRQGIVHGSVLILVTAAPALSFFGLWDNYMSWALYAGNKTSAQVYLSDAVYEKLPKAVQEYVDEDDSGVNTLSIAAWSFDELNVPAYPEARVYRAVAGAICRYADAPSDVRLVVTKRDTLLGRGQKTAYDCSALPH